MKIKIYTKKTQTTKVGIQKTTESTKRERKMNTAIFPPSLHCLSPLSCPKTPKIDIANKEIRFYRDLNSDRWIQSPEC